MKCSVKESPIDKKRIVKEQRPLFKYCDVPFMEEDFVPYLEKCPVCGSNDRKIVSHVKKKRFKFYKCFNCCAVSCSHYVKDELLNKLYSLPCEARFPDYKNGVYHDRPMLFAKSICPHLTFAKKEHLELLDYGGGNGLISYYIALILLATGKIESINITIVDVDVKNIVSSKDSKITISKVVPSEFSVISHTSVVGGGGYV